MCAVNEQEIKKQERKRRKLAIACMRVQGATLGSAVHGESAVANLETYARTRRGSLKHMLGGGPHYFLHLAPPSKFL